MRRCVDRPPRPPARCGDSVMTAGQRAHLGVNPPGRSGSGTGMSRPRVSPYQASVRRMPSVEGHAGDPAELVARPVRGHDPSLEVAGTGRAELHFDVTDEVADGLGDLADRDGLVAVEVVGPVLGDRVRAPAHEPARGPPRTRRTAPGRPSPSMRSGSPRKRPLEERRGHAVVAHPRAVRDAVAQHRVGPAVERVVVAAHHLRRRPWSVT